MPFRVIQIRKAVLGIEPGTLGRRDERVCRQCLPRLVDPRTSTYHTPSSWGKADPPHVYQAHVDPVVASSTKYTYLSLGLNIPRFDHSGQTTQLPTLCPDWTKGAATHSEQLGTLPKIARELFFSFALITSGPVPYGAQNIMLRWSLALLCHI